MYPIAAAGRSSGARSMDVGVRAQVLRFGSGFDGVCGLQVMAG